MVNAGKSSSLVEEMSAKVDELGPGFAWVFGPGADSNGHSLTLSGEGVLYKQLLTQYWLSQAPVLPGWTFYPSRQSGKVDGIWMDIDGQRFDPMEFWITPSVDCDAEKIDLCIWHPLFAKLGERERWTPVFLFLDEVLGEFGTQQWIGEVKLNDLRLRESVPLNELPIFIKTQGEERGWNKLNPGEEVVLYTLKEPHNHFPRGDIITWATVCPDLLKDYLKAEGQMDDPLAGTGADYIYARFDNKFLPAGQEATARGRIEDAVDAALRAANCGRLIGGAFGNDFAYVDLLIFDGEASIDNVKDTLRNAGLPSDTTIHYFARKDSPTSISS